jgi:hypothetical protein
MLSTEVWDDVRAEVLYNEINWVAIIQTGLNSHAFWRSYVTHLSAFGKAYLRIVGRTRPRRAF